MSVKNETIKVSQKFQQFDFEQYINQINEKKTQEKIQNFFKLVSKHDSETIELSKQIRIK